MAKDTLQRVSELKHLYRELRYLQILETK